MYRYIATVSFAAALGACQTMGGLTVKDTDAEEAPNEAVIVTGVAAVTWPALNVKVARATPPGTVTVAGTGAAVGFEVVRLTMAPPGGVALLSCTVAISSSPLNGAGRVRLRAVTLGGAVLTVKLATVDHAVTAAVVGELSPWAERMRQNLVPGVRDSTVKVGPLS